MKDNENNQKTNTLLLTVIGVSTLLVAVIGATFAFFTANINNPESASTIILKAGTLSVTYGDGTDTITATSLEPKAAVLGTKTFTVTGNNSTDTVMSYSINLVISNNTFTGSNYDGDGKVVETGGTHEDFIKYTLTGVNTGGNGTIISDIAKTAITTGAQTIKLGTGTFAGKVTSKVHTYTFGLYFEENGKNQDADKNKVFDAKIQIQSTGSSEYAVSTTTAP